MRTQTVNLLILHNEIGTERHERNNILAYLKELHTVPHETF